MQQGERRMEVNPATSPAKTRGTRLRDHLDSGSCTYGDLGDNGKLEEEHVDWMVIPSTIKC
jgi:hypothetical protein